DSGCANVPASANGPGDHDGSGDPDGARNAADTATASANNCAGHQLTACRTSCCNRSLPKDPTGELSSQTLAKSVGSLRQVPQDTASTGQVYCPQT
ncbi:hypothetical protein QQF64_034362, partial [Cirrhinus molitorella]